nr:ATP-binding cassette domain-containing protein [Atopococcus tabaci]
MLELKNVNKSFEDTLVLKNISLTFEENQTTVIVGPSGSGKSTLLRCMNLLETPEFGSLKMGRLFVSGHIPAGLHYGNPLPVAAQFEEIRKSLCG